MRRYNLHLLFSSLNVSLVCERERERERVSQNETKFGGKNVRITDRRTDRWADGPTDGPSNDATKSKAYGILQANLDATKTFFCRNKEGRRCKQQNRERHSYATKKQSLDALFFRLLNEEAQRHERTDLKITRYAIAS